MQQKKHTSVVVFPFTHPSKSGCQLYRELYFFTHFLADLIFYAYLWLKETLKPNAMIASILIFIVSWLIVGSLIIWMLYRILWFLWGVFYDDPKNDRHTHFFRPF